MKILGDDFLNLVQVVGLPLVFPLIVLRVTRMESVKKVGRTAWQSHPRTSSPSLRPCPAW
ncbi:hypothetical protein [Streptomyces yanii]|uniref:Uncharacterized protein n=1 Tax=Streptomyces yanii TaxID=78510 RepID=A0ABV5R8M3_9ACTN